MIDDLDRCSAERVVKLMETVHTLLREPAETRLLPHWRRPAPLIVLVLADGRWVRAAFEARYESFGALGSPVHGLGADFLQKVFDHIVLVPALAADQVQTYVDHVTGTPMGHRRPHRSRPGPGRHTRAGLPRSRPVRRRHQRSSTVHYWAERRKEAAPGEVHGRSVRAALDNTTGTERERLAEIIAAKAATTEALAAFTEDLLTRYTPLMPANPRLIKRVANAFGMLLALGLHLGHHEDEDTVARAAILLVRFPTLVDYLLSAPDPPVLDPPADAGSTGPSSTAPASPWLRRDVQQVLRRADGGRVDITRIARCYGRHYAPDPASSPAHLSPTTSTTITGSQPADPAAPTSLSTSNISAVPHAS